MISADKLTFGSDPEYGTTYTKNNLEYVQPPAYFRKYLEVDFIPDKKHPVFIKDGEITVMEDGCAFEFTLPAFDDSADLYQSIQQGQFLLANWLSNFDYKLVTVPTLPYEVANWIYEDKDFKRCLIFGCDKDYDAIDPTYECKVRNALKHPWRYFGGHLHIGSLDPDVVDFLHKRWKPYIQLLACLVGTTGIAHSPYPDLEKVRSKVYGSPGRYRLPKWGIEYRTLSNAWTESSLIVNEIVERAKIAFEIVQDTSKAFSILANYSEPAKQAIENSDKELAIQILKDLNEVI